MHGAPVALTLVALLLAPSVAAEHPLQRDLARELMDASEVMVLVQETGGARGNAEGSWEEDPEHGEDRFDWRYDWNWSAYGALRGYRGQLGGDGALELMLDAALHETSHAEAQDPDGLIYRHSSETNCRMRVTEKDLSEPARRVAFQGTVIPARNVLRLTVLGASHVLLPDDAWSPCARSWSQETRDEGARTGTDEMGGPDRLALSAHALDGLLRGDPRLVVDVPLDSPTVRKSGAVSFPLPGEGKGESNYCPSPRGTSVSADESSGTCAAQGTLRVSLWVNVCSAIRESYRRHLDAVRAIQPPDKGAPEAWVRAWAQEATKKIDALYSDLRELALLCDEDGDDSWVDDVMRVMVLHRDALVEIHRSKGLTPEGVRDFIATERSILLLGGEASDVPLGEILAGDGNGGMEVSTRSPVALHAWTEDGRHVGWNASAGAPEAGIEGARYEGEPGRAQRIALPPGFYKIEAVELAPGPYAVDVSWRGVGAEGNASFLAGAADGRTTVFYYAFEPAGEGDEMRADAFPTRRVPTSASFRFVEPGDVARIHRPEGATSLFGSGAPPARGGLDAGPTGDDAAGEPSAGGPRDAAQAPAREAPAAGLVALVVAALVAARVGRRP